MAIKDGYTVPSWLTPPSESSPVSQVLTTYSNPVTGEQFTAPTSGYTVNVGSGSDKPPLTINSFTPVGSGRALYEVSTNQGEFYYRPSEYITQGVKVGDTQYFNPQLLQKDVLQTGIPVNLDQSVIADKPLLNYGYENPGSGVLFPKSAHQPIVDAGVNYYSVSDSKGQIGGVANIDGENKYLLEGGSGNKYSFISPGGNITDRTVTVSYSGGGALGKVARSIAGAFGSVPLLTEATLLIPGAGPAIYGALKGAQLGMAGKSPLEAGLQVGATVAAPQIGQAILPAEIAAIPGATTAAGSTVAGLLSGQPVEQALQTGLAAGAGSAVGGEVAGSTGSQAAGQFVGGTTAGLLSGKDAAASAINALIGTTASQTGNLVNRALFSSGSSNMDDDSFWNELYAADAEQLAKQGIGQQQIADILQFSGANPFVAYDAAQLAAQGLGAADILKNIAQSSAAFTGGVPNGAAGNLASTAARSLLQKLTGTGGTRGTAGGTGGAGGNDLVKALLGTLFGTQEAGFGGLLSRGIDYATAERIANQLRSQGTALTQQATQAGQAAQVPFTPYTVTTGLGTSTFGPSGATATAAGPYQAVQQQALQQAQATLGAINPAQASQTLFGQLEGLQAPARQRQQEELLSRLGARGLLGFGQNLPTTGGGMGTVNPYMESLLSAQATQQAQNALAAQQFGTSEAARQQALAQNLTTQGMGIDQQTAALLTQAGNLGAVPMNLALTNQARGLEATLRGLGYQVPFSTAAANVQAGQTGLLGQTAKDVNAALLKELFG